MFHYQWTLGNYKSEFGEIQARGKRTYGIFIPIDADNFSDMEKDQKEVHTS